MLDDAMSDLYVILNRGTVVGNCALFWRHGGHGYTCDLDKAWQVDAKKAKDICCNRPELDFAIPLDYAVEHSERHCEANTLRENARMLWGI